MRLIRIIAVGRIKQSAKYLEAGIKLYTDRLKRDARIEWVEIPEGAESPTMPVARVQDIEAERILKHCPDGAFLLLLDERGKLLDSQTFARDVFPGNHPDGGRGAAPADPMMIVIGGAFGTADSLKAKASMMLSLSPMTFPHQMVRLLLLEQLYRAATIARGEPYHK